MLKLPSFLTKLEVQVLSAMVHGNAEQNEIFMAQFDSCKLERREINGYGFFTHFVMIVDVPALSWTNHIIHAHAVIGGESCGFMLWIEDGKIDFLEGYPLGGDAWPRGESIEGLTVD